MGLVAHRLIGTALGEAVKEDHFAAWSWGALAILINVFWISIDLYCHYTGRKLMTTQMKEWLLDPAIGPFVLGYGLVGSFTALMYHLLTRGKS